MTVSVAADPSAREAVELIEDGLAAGDVLIIVGQCDVVYDGQAESYLGLGDRLVIPSRMALSWSIVPNSEPR